MNMTNRILFAVLAMLLLSLAAGCPQSGTEATDTGSTASAGGATPAGGGWSGDAKDFAFTTFAGMTGKASDFAGKPLVVNFWAAW